MAWNEPGSNKDNDNDPWGGKRKSQGPPDLEQIIRQLRKKFMATFGYGSSSSNMSADNANGWWVGLVTLLLLTCWLISGIYIVNPAEQAVVLRFGRYIDTVGPGIHWNPRFIDRRFIVNVQQIQTLSYTADMLTNDTNIISVQFTVPYQIDNPRDYLFNSVNPRGSLEQATASAVRQVIAQTPMDAVLSSGRENVRSRVQELLVQTMANYQSGLLINDVNFQLATPPQAVAKSFDDAIQAYQDKKRYVDLATAYRAGIMPVAMGQAERLRAMARAYEKQVVLAAQGNVAAYLSLLPEYKKSPQIMRERLYLEALESVYSKNNKIMVDTPGTNVMYLPLDKWISQAATSTTNAAATSMPNVTDTTATTTASNNTVIVPHESDYELAPDAQMKLSIPNQISDQGIKQ